MAELKPCPFCGQVKKEDGLLGNLYVDEYDVEDGTIFYIFCDRCGTCGPQRKSEQQAIDAWNKRS